MNTSQQPSSGSQPDYSFIRVESQRAIAGPQDGIAYWKDAPAVRAADVGTP
jgi:hypothetical protein